jgi:hypothetical protein
MSNTSVITFFAAYSIPNYFRISSIFERKIVFLQLRHGKAAVS